MSLKGNHQHQQRYKKYYVVKFFHGWKDGLTGCGKLGSSLISHFRLA